MANVAQLVCGATTTDINDLTNFKVESYTPNPGADSEEMVTETMTIQVKGASVAAIKANRDKIFAMAENCKLFRENGYTVNPVYLNFEPNGGTELRRALLWEIKCVSEDKWIDEPLQVMHLVHMDLEITRYNYAEGTSEVSLALTNTNVTGHDWARCYTCNDGTGAANFKKVNWASLSGTLISGDMPAPVKITFGLAGAHTLFYGVAQNIDPTGTYYWEGETIYPAGSAVDANCSAGHYSTFPAGMLLDFAPDGTKTKGGWFLPLVSAKVSATGVLITMIPDEKVVTEAKTAYPVGYTTTDFCLFALAPIKLANIYNGSFTPSQSIGLIFSVNTEVDFVTLIPLDSWRRADSMVTTPDPDVLYECTVDNPFCSFGDSTTILYSTAVRGPGIWLEPGKDAKIFVMGGAESNIAVTIAQEVDIALSYRPRWRSL